MRPAAATLLGLLLTADCVPAGTALEHYQAALMQEKGEGDLEKAILLYEDAIGSHEEGEEGTDSLAARAKLRIWLCQKKLGLARARRTYEAVIEEYPAVEESLAHEKLKDFLEQAAVEESLAHEKLKDFLEQAAIDSVLRQNQEALLPPIEAQIRVIRGSSGTSPTSDQRYHEYANTPVVVPYSYEEVAEVPLHWKFRLEVDDPHPQRHAYSAPGFDDTDWSIISIGRAWEDQGYAGYDAGAWYRTTITVAADSARPVLMAFGGVDNDAFVYVNGRLAGQHHSWDLPFILDVSDHVVRDGENVVALFVYDGANMGGVYGLINVHQPTEEVDIGYYAANRGGRMHTVYRRGDRPYFVHLTRYEKYANRPPRVPYPHQMVAEVPMEWAFRLDVGTMNPQRRRQYADPDYNDSQWTVISIGQAWEDQGYPYDEGAWYRTRFMVDAEEDRPVHLAFGGVDRDAYVYVNGHLVGQHHVRDRPFILDISSQVVRDGENTVAIYVYDGADMGGVYGLIQVVQPTGEENLDRYLVNRGGEVKRSFWSRFF